MTPLQTYQIALGREDFFHDCAQESVVLELESLHQRLVQGENALWSTTIFRKPQALKGLYIWGPVGRGKTYLMDSFYGSLPEGMAVRLHFHRFMQRVHSELRRLSGQKNPLQLFATELARHTRVLCFDEFYVADIGDAMILGNLLQALFQAGVCLVATSNIPPDNLYMDGLQRRRFLPTIELLNRSTKVVALHGERDYRLRPVHFVDNYISPLNALSETRLQQLYNRLRTAGERSDSGALTLNGRQIPVRGKSSRVVWFEFAALCDGPRSQLDYIEISNRFDVVIVSNIPVLGGAQRTRKVAIGTEDSRDNSIGFIDRSLRTGLADDPARRFIALVDEFYDAGVHLVISAAAPIRQLYRGGQVSFEFRRTVSRLIEMQSEEYSGAVASREHSRARRP